MTFYCSTTIFKTLPLQFCCVHTINTTNFPGSMNTDGWMIYHSRASERTMLTFDKSYLCANVRMQLILPEHQRKAKLTFENPIVIAIVRNLS